MKRNKAEKSTYVILHDIRSIHNVGSIFRTSDAAGISKIFLTGYTPTPHDRFGRVRGDVAKVALGAEKSVAWEYEKNPAKLIKQLKKEGVHVIAIEQHSRAKDYKKIRPRFPVAFVFGNEVNGIPKNILSLCNEIAEIPMRGKKESLNVSVSAGISLFRILDK